MSSVPRASRVWTATSRAWPPSLKDDPVPGIRIDPGKSPAVTIAGWQIRRRFGGRTTGRLRWWYLSRDGGGDRCGSWRRGILLCLCGRPCPVDLLLQRRQDAALLLDRPGLAIERRALLGKQLPQFRNRRVSVRRRLRERGTGRHEQRTNQYAEPNTTRSHRGVLLRRLKVRGRFERPAGGAMLDVPESAL